MAEKVRPLQPGWSEHTSPDGVPYFYNQETGQSVWIRPEVTDEEEPLSAAEKPSTDKTPSDEVQQQQATERLTSTDKAPGEHQESERVKNGTYGKQVSGAERAALKRKLAEPDAIMEVDAMELLQQWMSGCNSAEETSKAASEAVDLLSSGYRGYADMVNLLIDWLNTCSPKSTDPDSKSEKLGLKVASKHISKLVSQKFDKDRIAQVVNDLDKPPEWLVTMLQSSAWRRLLIELAGDSRNKQVPFLEFCVKAMVQEGHHSEIAKVTNPSAYFSVFLRTLEDLLVKVLRKTDAKSLHEAETKFYRLCSQVQYTHLFALEVLTALEGGDTVDLKEGDDHPLSVETRCKCRRLRQGLADSNKDVVSQHKATELLNALNRKDTLGLSNREHGFPELASLLNGVVDRRGFSADILSRFYDLYNPESSLYSGGEGTLKLPPIWPLRTPVILGLLTKQLFQPFKSTTLGSPESTGAYLLACATARPGSDASKGSSLDVARDSQPQVMEVKQAIMAVLKVCRSDDSLSIKALHRQSQQMILLVTNVKKYPPVSAGVLLWIRACYCAPKFQRSSAFTTGVLSFMYLIRCIIRSHPLQRAQTFFVLCQIFPLKPASVFSTKMLELQQYILDEMVVLMQVGYVLPVMEFMRRQATTGEIDHSLLRHFVVRLIKSASPPYSNEFRNALVELLNTKSCARAVRSGISGDMSKTIQQLRQRAKNGDVNNADASGVGSKQVSSAKSKNSAVRLVPFQRHTTM